MNIEDVLDIFVLLENSELIGGFCTGDQSDDAYFAIAGREK